MANRESSFRGSRIVRGGALVLTVSALTALTGCNTGKPATDGAGTGALLGAAAGAVIGHQSGEAGKGAAIGAAGGAGLGYIIGNESEKKQRQQSGNYNY